MEKMCNRRVLSICLTLLTAAFAFACGQSGDIAYERVDAHIKFLSSDDLMGRDPVRPEIRVAEDYIAQQFAAAGLKQFPQFNGYRQEFEYKPRSRRNPDADLGTFQVANVVGYLEGTDPALKNEYILIGAHHDHIGIQPAEEDSICNGADDNATGTVAVITLAEYFAAKKLNKRSVIFATFTGEERGLVGSRHLASNLPIENDQLVCMINFEMLGKPAEDGSFTLMMLGPEYSTLDEISKAAVGETADVMIVDPREDQLRYYRASDNGAFVQQGFITCTFASPFSTGDPVYHTPADEYELLNIDYMTKAIITVAKAVEPLLTGEATPVKTEG